MDKKHFVINKIICGGFLGYILVLFVERLIALILSPSVQGAYAFSNGFFPITAYVITIVSIVAAFGIFFKQVIGIAKTLFLKETYDLKANYKPLILGSCVLLVSGMMYTGFTISGLQFVAYGLLIAAMIAHTVEECFDGKDKFSSIISVIYLTCFSMCIPVCHISAQAVPFSVLYYVAEFLAVAVLIPVFYILLRDFFDLGRPVFNVYYFALMIVLAGLVIGFQWKESINYFVIGAVGATIIAYVVALIGTYKRANK